MVYILIFIYIYSLIISVYVICNYTIFEPGIITLARYMLYIGYETQRKKLMRHQTCQPCILINAGC